MNRFTRFPIAGAGAASLGVAGVAAADLDPSRRLIGS